MKIPMENYINQCKIVRQTTMAPMKDVAAALLDTKGDVDAAIELLSKKMSKGDAAAMANRSAEATIVYSYVHNYRIGAMIVIASQTDFVAKSDIFLELAKDICLHIVSSPNIPEYVSESDVPAARKEVWHNDAIRGLENKPQAVLDKIVVGKIKKQLDELCLLNQPFVKDDTITVQELINRVTGKLKEKIEVKSFVRMVAK